MNRRFEYLSVATAIGGFLAVSYVACVAWDAVFPQWAMRGAWAQLLPGFEWLSIGTFRNLTLSSGSSPTVGSSTMSTFGSLSNA